MARTRSKSTAETTVSNGSVAKTTKTVEKTTTTKRKAADDGPKPRKTKKAAVAVEETEEEPAAEKPKPQRIPTKASAQRIPKELDPSKDVYNSDSSEDEGVLTIAEKVDPEDDDVEEGESAFQPGQDVGKIPKPKKAKKNAGQEEAETGTGVVYVGRIPHGFYENELKSYLSQFGPVLNIRLSRNKKTGASKHFAFIEFAEYSTAETVVKTMDNYLLFGHILKVRMVAKSDVHEELFKGANKRFKKVPWNKIRGKELEKPQTEEAWQKKVSKVQNKRAKKAAQLKELGYEFEAPALKAVPPPVEMVVDEVPAVEAAEETKAIEAPVVVEKVVVETPEVVEEVTTKIKAKSPKAKASKGKSRKSM